MPPFPGLLPRWSQFRHITCAHDVMSVIVPCKIDLMQDVLPVAYRKNHLALVSDLRLIQDNVAVGYKNGVLWLGLVLDDEPVPTIVGTHKVFTRRERGMVHNKIKRDIGRQRRNK